MLRGGCCCNSCVLCVFGCALVCVPWCVCVSLCRWYTVSTVQENRSLTLDVRIPSTVITDGDEDEGDADAGGSTPALASKPAQPAARDGAAPAAKEGEEKEKLADSVGSGGGEPENARERELMRSLRRREVEVAQLMNSARESRRTMAAQQAEIERLQQHVRSLARTRLCARAQALAPVS